MAGGALRYVTQHYRMGAVDLHESLIPSTAPGREKFAVLAGMSLNST